MSEATIALARFVGDATVEYRKGAEVEQKDSATHIYAMPEVPSRGVLVDVHFISVGFTELAADREPFVRLLVAALNAPGEFGDISPERFCNGPSYIEIGAWIGSQDLALRLMALGELFKIWDVITPAGLGMTGPEANQMAGMGLVMVGPKAGLADLLGAASAA